MSKYDALWSYIKNCHADNITLTYEEIRSIAAVPIDHSFLRYKKELTEYDWKVGKIYMKEQKVLFEKMQNNTSLPRDNDNVEETC